MLWASGFRGKMTLADCTPIGGVSKAVNPAWFLAGTHSKWQDSGACVLLSLLKLSLAASVLRPPFLLLCAVHMSLCCLASSAHQHASVGMFETSPGNPPAAVIASTYVRAAT